MAQQKKPETGNENEEQVARDAEEADSKKAKKKKIDDERTKKNCVEKTKTAINRNFVYGNDKRTIRENIEQCRFAKCENPENRQRLASPNFVLYSM